MTAEKKSSARRPGEDRQDPGPVQEAAHTENLLEEALEESFPASDPAASNRFD